MTQSSSADILERLRAEVDPDVNEPIDRLLDEAADEIVRLREAKRRALQLADERAKEAAELRQALDGAARAIDAELNEVIAYHDIHSERFPGMMGTRSAKLLRELKALRSHNLAQPEWQPIETAAKDGTPMLLCNYDSPEQDVLPVVSGFWSRLSEGWYAEQSCHKVNPTHWMPLMAPPTLTMTSTEQHSLPGHEETQDALNSLTIRPVSRPHRETPQ